MKQDTLLDRIRTGTALSDKEKESLLHLVAKGTREKTRNRLRSLIFWHPIAIWEQVGRYGRVHIENEEVSYCAGQSYPDEIRDLRNHILGR